MGNCSRMEPKYDVIWFDVNNVMSCNMMSTTWCQQSDVRNMMSTTWCHQMWCLKLDVHKQVTKSMFTARPIELVHSVGMNPDCIVHWTLVWTVHSEDHFRRSQSATTTRPCFGPSVRRLWDPRTESCLNFISNCHFTFHRMRIFVRGAVIACWPHSRFWVKDSHSKLADSFDESLDLSDWLKSGDSFSSSV